MLKPVLLTRDVVVVGVLCALLLAQTPLLAQAMRVEPFDAPKADIPMSSQPFYTDPYTASLLNGSQPLATSSNASYWGSTNPSTVTPANTSNSGYWASPAVSTPAATTNTSDYWASPTTAPNSGTVANTSATTTSNPSGYWGTPALQPINTTSGYQPLQANVTYIPKGETFTIQLNDAISTQTAHVGDAVRATLDAPIYLNGQQVAPAGSEVSGTVTRVSPASRFGKHGEMELRMMSLRKPSGERVALEGSVVTQDGNPLLRGDTYPMDVLKGVGIAVGGTALGAVSGLAIGGIIGAAGSGAAVGTAVGAAAGIGYAAARKGKSVDLQNGTRLRIKLDQPAAIGVY
jgi:hypothetical protein